MGKGSQQRPCDRAAWERGWEAAFGSWRRCLRCGRAWDPAVRDRCYFCGGPIQPAREEGDK